MTAGAFRHWRKAMVCWAGAVLLLAAQDAEAGWLDRVKGAAMSAEGIAIGSYVVHEASVLQSLKQNAGELIDLFGDMLDAVKKGDTRKAGKIWTDVEKVPGDIVREAFPVFRVMDAAAALAAGIGKRLAAAKRHIERFAGAAGGVDPRGALAISADEQPFYTSATGILGDEPLPAVQYSKSERAVSGRPQTETWEDGSRNDDRPDSTSAADFLESHDRYESSLKALEKLWAASRGGTTERAEPERGNYREALEALDRRRSKPRAERRRQAAETKAREARKSTQKRTKTAQRRAERDFGKRAQAAHEQKERSQRMPKGVFRDCPMKCPEMVVVPAGSFTMGSPGRFNSEGPQHRVTIGHPFAVGKYEVTRVEFSHFVSETGYSTGNICETHEDVDNISWWGIRDGRHWRKPGFDQTQRDPVVCVNWKDAKAYVAWLSRKTGAEYRLLSESEWEYAARGGTTTTYIWGTQRNEQCRHANAADVSAKKIHHGDWHAILTPCNDGYLYTSPVGSFAPNAFGLYDMTGNVWEWVEDCWHDDYAGAPSDGKAWTTGSDCRQRVARGGSWYTGSRGNRPSARGYKTASGNFKISNRGHRISASRMSSVGFRVARKLD